MYHDETKKAGDSNFKGHVLFFVPLRIVVETSTPLFGSTVHEYYPRAEIVNRIQKLREQYSATKKLHFSDIGGRTWTKYDDGVRGIVELGVESLRHQGTSLFDYPMSCKLAVMFYPPLSEWDIYGGDERKEQRLRHDETVLRMLLKGAAHYLYDEQHRIEILQIVSDGEPEHRRLDEERIVWQLTYDDIYGRSPLRDYVSFVQDATITHLISDHRKYPEGSEEYIHANMLQLADLLLGSVIRSCYKGFVPVNRIPRVGDECVKKDVIATPVRKMLDKTKRGAGFKYSGHYKSFVINQVEFSEHGANFNQVKPIEIQVDDEEKLQMRFFSTRGA